MIQIQIDVIIFMLTFSAVLGFAAGYVVGKSMDNRSDFNNTKK